MHVCLLTEMNELEGKVDDAEENGCSDTLEYAQE